MAEPLYLQTVSVNGERAVFVTGELDLATAPTLAACLAEIDGADLILDLWNLEFIDSSGISVIVEEHKRREADGNTLTLRWARGPVLRVLELSKLDTVLRLDGRGCSPDRRAGVRAHSPSGTPDTS